MRRKGTTLLLDRLLTKGTESKEVQQKIADILLGGSKTAAAGSKPVILKGVHRGRFHRIKLDRTPDKKSETSHLPKLPNGPYPHAFKSVKAKLKTISNPNSKNIGGAAAASSFRGGEGSHQEQFAEWWKENWSTVILNLGSLATLIGFTRSDVLELRCLSVTGSAANMIYHFSFSPARYLAAGWSAIFASVNGVKIKEIIQERHQSVKMTPEQESIYVELFLPHGITPRQFQILEERAEKITLPQGEAIIRQGEEIDHVKLVVSGSTRASISGRRLTAASAICPKSITEDKAGGNSGAWIGEMSFLETYWNKEEKKNRKKKVASTTENKAGEEASTTAEKPVDTVSTDDTGPIPASLKGNAKGNDDPAVPTSPAPRTITERNPVVRSRNRYTIVAASDCVVWRWHFDDVEDMMSKSTDFRASLSRAMTSAIVSKVINFTVGKTSNLPTWQSWLDDWRYNAGASVTVKTDMDDLEGLEDKSDEDEDEVRGITEHGVV